MVQTNIYIYIYSNQTTVLSVFSIFNTHVTHVSWSKTWLSCPRALEAIHLRILLKESHHGMDVFADVLLLVTEKTVSWLVVVYCSCLSSKKYFCYCCCYNCHICLRCDVCRHSSCGDDFTCLGNMSMQQPWQILYFHKQ